MSISKERRQSGQVMLTYIHYPTALSYLLTFIVVLTSLTQAAILHKHTTTKQFLRNHLEDVGAVSNSPILPSWTSSNSSSSEKWRKTGVRFLTKAKRTGDAGDNLGEGGTDEIDISANDFHIIELEPGKSSSAVPYGDHSSPETLQIHLMKKSSIVHPDLRVVIRDGDSVEDWNNPHKTNNNCHFIGQVTSPYTKSESERSAQISSQGIAVLSACTPAKGFSGLIMMDDGRHWYMEPVLQDNIKDATYRQKRETLAESDSLEHVVLADSELAGHIASHISDALRVPLPQLEEAARLAAKDAEARLTMRYDWDDDPDESLLGESSILTPFLHSGATLPFLSRGVDRAVPSKVSQARKVVNSRKPSVTTLLKPLEPSESSTHDSPESTPVKETRVVEIAVFTDEELLNKMKAKFGQDTTTQLKEYATAMVNMMDVMYQHSTLGVNLRFRLVYLEVMKRKPNSLKTNGGKAKAYLSSFCDYAGEKNVNSAQWDHALLLTGIDLQEEGVKTTAGLAWAGTMCFRYYSCSISEALNFASAYITTHEIGHSLGMEHDGTGISETCDSSKYIMSPTTGPGKVTWSSCSSTNLQDFIKYGTSELRGKTQSNNARMISRPICLEELVARNKKSIEEDSSESDLKLPGEKYDANFQCSLGMGSFFKPHFERHKPPFDNICWILYCGNGTHAISTHPALEGTPCDRKKYCRGGQCVKRPDT